MDKDLERALEGNLLVFRNPSGKDLLTRNQDLLDWVELRMSHKVWPFTRSHITSPETTCEIVDFSGNVSKGVNFASQDYLSLSNHRAIKDAAIAALEEFGVHSAGSSALMGNTSVSAKLEKKLAAMLNMDHVVLFPTGWAAGFGISNGLIRGNDWVVIDSLAHACLQTGAIACTQKLQRFKHNDLESLETILHGIRSEDSDNAILIITESLFSMDSDSPDLKAMQGLANKYSAALMVDVAHDFGSMGPDGTGELGTQGVLGKVDFVMGSFSKTFASNGGFVATNSKAAAQQLRCYSSPCMFSNALSPIQAAVILKSCEIIQSEEGQTRRNRLMNNISLLREQLESNGVCIMGEPSPIVPALGGEGRITRLAVKSRTIDNAFYE